MSSSTTANPSKQLEIRRPTIDHAPYYSTSTSPSSLSASTSPETRPRMPPCSSSRWIPSSATRSDSRVRSFPCSLQLDSSFHVHSHPLSYYIGILYTPVERSGHTSWNVAMRQQLDIYASLVLCKSVPGFPTRHRDVDFAIIRENTEGEYSGLEHQVSRNDILSLVRRGPELGGR